MEISDRKWGRLMTDTRGTSSGANLETPYFTEAPTEVITKPQHALPISDANRSAILGSAPIGSTGELQGVAQIISSAHGNLSSSPGVEYRTTTVVIGNQQVNKTIIVPATSSSSAGSTSSDYSISGHKVTVKTYAIKRD